MVPEPLTCTVVVPCYNESHRLDTAAFADLAAQPGITVLFVDDGSTDATATMLDSLAEESADTAGTMAVLRLGSNQGKAEAVRQGLLAALRTNPAMVAYFDADLATPTDELLRLIGILADHTDRGDRTSGILASRVLMLGRRIDRRATRHYLGRVFATAAAMALGTPVYDTQCGAKVFRATDGLALALDRPFRSRWAFDVELLARLADADPTMLGPDPAIIEEPLQAWVDVPGSAMSLRSMLRSGLDVVVLLLRRLLGRTP